jgi:NADH-quinone oxidoreductase subunit J
MLLGPDAGDGEGTVARARLARYGAGAFFFVLAAGAAHLVSRADLTAHRFKIAPAAHGSVEGIGTLLFGSMVIPFELATALLIVAVVGAIAVARGKPHVRHQVKSASPTARMFHGPLMARDAQRPLPTKAERAAKAAGGV